MRISELLENINENKINFTMPNFDFEWEEANRYEQYRALGKEEWIKLAKTGKAVDVDNRMANDIENTEAGEEYRYDYWDGLVKAKRDRFTKALSSGQIELPIIARYSDGQMELISGNTRLTGMMRELGRAKAWIYDVPDEVADLEENFADGKVKGKNIEEGPQDFADMKLDGNKLQQSLDYFYTDHAPNKIGGRKEAGSLKGHDVVTFTKGSDTLMFLVDKDDRAVFYVAYSDLKDGVAVGNVRSNGKVRATEVYAYLVDKFGTLYSDSKQTPQGRKIWSDLAKFFPDIEVTDTGDRLRATKESIEENFADGKVKGKSRPGRFKKAGVSCKGSVSSLRKKAKNSSGERQKGYHFCANMKSGRKKK